ncbi:MAG: glycosyltransferase family 4 protein [Gammaproteobacteria bacterium]|nr:glycosyltransferase family 4 protein [Gammaproteobacteria bacterium]
MTHVCFVSMTVYPVLHGETRISEVGGAELQQVQIARLLLRMGHQVSFVTLDHGQPDGEMIQGCRVYKAYKPHAGLPGLRFIFPRWTGVWSALRRVNADIYYTRAAGFMPGMLALLRLVQPLRYVYAAAHDFDFTHDKVQIAFARDRWLFRFGLRRADAVIVQTEVQRSLLKANYGRDSVLIANFLDAEPVDLPEASRTRVLWVGKHRAIKRPLMFARLARALPELSFTMIGPHFQDDSALYDEVREAARTLPNLEILGFQPLQETEKHFDRASVFVSTSEKEGFPNVFLQAMRRGVPIVSFVDPDGMIGRNPELGAVVDSEEELIAAVRKMGKPPLRPARAIQACFARHFGAESVADKYRELLERLQA